MSPIEGYPHEGGCVCCRVRKVCNVCGGALDSGRCTNGRCSHCHVAHCTSEGNTGPGHGFGKVGTSKARR